MPIVRVAALTDSRQVANAKTSCEEGTIYDLGGITAGRSESLYGALHILTSSTGGLKVRIQGSSSSAGGGMTDYIAFTSQSCRGGEWGTAVTTGTLTTERQFWRAIWEMTTSGESYQFVTGMGFK
jgi:hypothetical protein